MPRITKLIYLLILLGIGLLSGWVPTVNAGEMRQEPTGTIPTVTGTASGPTVTVRADQDEINVRNGPGTNYDIVGVLVAGQTAPALGRNTTGSWIQIAYPGVAESVGWVYEGLISLSSGSLPIIEPPPLPTRATPTIDPTLAAQFIIEPVATRLPTFTPPPPLVIPTYTDEVIVGSATAVPMGLVIVLLAVAGLFGTAISVFRGR